jgi:hypothetical protein
MTKWKFETISSTKKREIADYENAAAIRILFNWTYMQIALG